MNGLELLTYLRRNILDDTSDYPNDWTTINYDDVEAAQLLWTNEELVGFINEAQREACRRSLLLEDTTTLSIVSGTSEYTLDPDILKIKYAYVNSTGKRIEATELFEYEYMDNWFTRTGEIESYIKDYKTNTFRPYRIPDANDTVTLFVYRLPLTAKELDWSSPTFATTAIEINSQWHVSMLYYAAYLAYLKQDVDSFDKLKATEFLGLFSKEFSDTSAYSETRKIRSRHKVTRYGGIPM